MMPSDTPLAWALRPATAWPSVSAVARSKPSRSATTAAQSRRAIRSSASRSDASGATSGAIYLAEGRDDPIRITIPEGRYAPAFEAMDPTSAPGSIDGLEN